MITTDAGGAPRHASRHLAAAPWRPWSRRARRLRGRRPAAPSASVQYSGAHHGAGRRTAPGLDGARAQRHALRDRPDRHPAQAAKLLPVSMVHERDAMLRAPERG